MGMRKPKASVELFSDQLCKMSFGLKCHFNHRTSFALLRAALYLTQ